LYEPNIADLSPAGVEDEVRRVRQRPLFYGILVVAFFAFGLWYMTGGSANGSPHQAEQLIISGSGADTTFDGLAPQASPATVHCTQNSQGLFARLYGLVGGGSTQGRPSNDPLTYYTCSGASTTGQPMYWCVTYPPRMNHFNQSPRVSVRLPEASCP
jgi:hypothetical protein